MAKTLGNMLPPNENWIVGELKKLKTAVKDLKSGRSILNNAGIDAGGIQITKGGSLKVIDTDGHLVAIIGALPSPAYDRSDGTPQPGVLINREDGSVALVLGDINATTPPYKQALALFDRSGNTVIADDTNSGMGLARPHLDSGGMENTNVLTWPATTNTTFTSIASKYMEMQNPLLTWQIQMFCDAGITAQYRLLVNGTQIGTTQSVAANSFGFWSANAAIPAGVHYGDVPLIELQAKTSATSASARAVCYRMSGQQS